jgi:hypothetical protein
MWKEVLKVAEAIAGNSPDSCGCFEKELKWAGEGRGERGCWMRIGIREWIQRRMWRKVRSFVRRGSPGGYSVKL